MKKSIILTSLLLICIIGQVFAETVKEDKARVAAQNWYRHYAPDNKKSASVARFSEYKHNERTAFYIYNFDQGGFVLVSANDAVTPVLGYGFEHSAPEEITNESVKSWFDNYARQIDTTLVLNLKNEEMTSKWQEVLEDRIPVKNGKSVGPLLTTTWDQGCYYNAMCPDDMLGPCGRTWVGCTATAMAQIMKYWNYPAGGIGQNEYYPKWHPEYGKISAFFNETDYGWSNMPLNVTSPNQDIAELSFHCGVAANMNYSYTGSGAYITDALVGLNKYFDYSDSMSYLRREFFADGIWIDKIKNELNQNRPVMYCGYNSTQTFGHTWVCDGYNSLGYFHMNWGWGGSYNGNWEINNLIMGFNYYHRIVMGIEPKFSNLNAEFEVRDSYSVLEYRFFDFSTGNPDSCFWSFDDGVNSNLRNPIHTFDSSGFYNIQLVVYKSNLTDTINRIIEIKNNPFIITTNDIGFFVGGEACFVDSDNDNDLDILAGGYPLGSRQFLNDSGAFSPINTNFQMVYPYYKISDMDNDGYLDVLAYNNINTGRTWENKLFLNESGTFNFSNIVFEGNLTLNSSDFVDYNNDGKMDVAINGVELYKNIGNSKFKKNKIISSKVANPLPFHSRWADFNNDGFIDLAFHYAGGWDGIYGMHVVFFKNNGNDSFTDVGFVSYSSMSFTQMICTDYNNDGLQDLLLTSDYGKSILYKNNGDFIFSNIADNVFSTLGAKISDAGDYNNDGLIDFIIGSNLIINLGDDNFAKIDAEIANDQSKFGDYDGDGDLDLFNWGWPSYMYENKTKIVNSSPTIPFIHAAETISNKVILSWASSLDNSTPQVALSYNINIGTTTTNSDIVSSNSSIVDGFRKIVQYGNVSQDTQIVINNLPNGKYYWRVQAIDNSFAASDFSIVDSFNIAGLNLPPDLVDFTQKVNLNTPKHFSKQSFLDLYVDPENDTLRKIRIDSLPVYGNLIYKGVNVYRCQEIPVDSIENILYLTNVFTDDYFYVSPNDGTNWGLTGTKIDVNVLLFESSDFLATNDLSFFSCGDYDNDGNLDLASTNSIYKNTNGLFQALEIGSVGSGSVNWGDIDSDQDLDLIVGEKIFKNTGSDQFDCTQTVSTVLYDETADFGDSFTNNTLDYLYSGIENSGNFATKICLNSGQGVFSDSTSNILGFRSGAVAWGDYDNDGDQDIAICGIYNSNNQRKTSIYRNDNGVYSEILTTLPGVNVGTLDWADFDRDGDLDLLICGSQGTIYNAITKIYRNNNEFFEDFLPWTVALPGIYRGFAKWVDVDADGFADIVLSGFIESQRSTKIYRNNNGISFSEIASSGLPNLAFVSGTIGDFNNDGYLDILFSGINENNDTITAIYRNCYGADTVMVNTPPSVPTNLYATQTPTGVNLQWDKSTDNSTPQNTLSYNIFVSRHPDSLFIMSPMANLSTGFRKVPRQGNTSLNNFWHIDSLPPGTYYWSVQAIDNSFAGGPFAPEQSFTILPPCSSSWTPLPNLQYNMQIVAQILINGQVSLNPNDVVGAFVGDECRGIGSPSPEFNGLVFLTVSSDVASGEQIELKIWKSNECSECNAIPGFAFVNQAEIGTFLEPYQVRCGAIQDITFGQGYTWFSLNVNPGSMSPNSLFTTLTPCYDDRVIGQTSFALFTGSSWIGSLTNLGLDKMYRMKLCSAQSLSLMGDAAPLSTIILAAGYTWLGYQPQECQSVSAAMAGLSPGPSYDDRVIGQNSFALFTGTTWVGSLTQMCPGKGYVIKLANSQSLTYPTSSAKSSSGEPQTVELVSPTGIYPEVNHQHTMMVVAKLQLPDGMVSLNEKDVIYAYIEGEVRGIGHPMTGADGTIFLSIAENTEHPKPITFMVWLDEQQQLLPLNETLSFKPLAAMGELNNPFILTLGEMVGLNEMTDGIWIGEPYPNPFTKSVSIKLYVAKPSEVTVNLYDPLGARVYRQSVNYPNAGLYTLDIEPKSTSSNLYHLELMISQEKSQTKKYFKIIKQ